MAPIPARITMPKMLYHSTRALVDSVSRDRRDGDVIRVSVDAQSDDENRVSAPLSDGRTKKQKPVSRKTEGAATHWAPKMSVPLV